MSTLLTVVSIDSQSWHVNNHRVIFFYFLYKSTSSTEYNTNLLIDMLKKAVDKHGISHLLIFGDFNFPEIDWMNCLIKGSDSSLPAKFVDISYNTGSISKTACC